MSVYDTILDDFYDRKTANVITYMNFLRELTSEVTSIRKANNIPESYPLISLDIYAGDKLFPLINGLWYQPASSDEYETPYRGFIKDFCNVDEVVLDFSAEWPRTMYGISESITLDFRKAGPVFGKDMGRVSKAVKSGNYKRVDDGIEADGIFVSSEYYSFKSEAPDISSGVKILDGDTFIVLDTRLGFGKSKYVSGILRREINSVRKTVGVDLTSLVDVVVFDSAENISYYNKHDDFIKSEAKVSSIEYRVSDVGRSVALGSSRFDSPVSVRYNG